MTPEKQLTAAERYAAAIAKRPSATVKVIAPKSGFEFEFRQPSKLGFILKGIVPQSLTNKAAAAWQDAATGDVQEDESEEDNQKILDTLFKLRDMVLTLSVNPKIVLGEPKADNEISAECIDDDDLEFFVMFMASGGDEAAALENFRRKQGSDVGIRTNVKKRKPRSK